MTEPPPDVSLRPRLRGVSHQWAAVVAVGAGVALVIAAPTTRSAWACAIYAASVFALFATSAIYHRVRWKTAAGRRTLRRVDHAMIFVLIAGSNTPFALIVLDGTLATVVFLVSWIGAIAGILMEVFWIDSPRWLKAVIYIGLGWTGIIAAPEIVNEIGWWAALGVAFGGVLYSLGAVVYARRKPDPWPMTFGYHEIFHVLVIVAAAIQYCVIAFGVLPEA